MASFESLDEGVDPIDWLKGRAESGDWLLAHADDGVIWGRVHEGRLVTSSGLIDESPPLRSTTLQQARLFHRDRELLLWREDDSSPWYYREIRDDGPEVSRYAESYDEYQMLWGTEWESKQWAGVRFTVAWEGQGLRHAVPLEVNWAARRSNAEGPPRRPLRLQVRHYLVRDSATGEARIAATRLCNLIEVQ